MAATCIMMQCHSVKPSLTIVCRCSSSWFGIRGKELVSFSEDIMLLHIAYELRRGAHLKL